MAEETERQVRAERLSPSRQSRLRCVSSCVQISVPDTWGSYQELTLSSHWKSKRCTHMSRPARVHEWACRGGDSSRPAGAPRPWASVSCVFFRGSFPQTEARRWARGYGRLCASGPCYVRTCRPPTLLAVSSFLTAHGTWSYGRTNLTIPVLKDSNIPSLWILQMMLPLIIP